MKLLRPVTVPAHLAEKWRTNIQLLVEDRAIPIFSEIFDGDIAVQNITLPKPDFTKATMICRSAGIGDIFFIGFALQKLRNMGVKSDLALYGMVDHTWIFQRFFSLDVAWLHAPCLYDSAVKRYPNIVNLEHSIEHVDIQVQRKTHITSLFASGLNVELSPAELPGLLKAKPEPEKIPAPWPKVRGDTPGLELVDAVVDRPETEERRRRGPRARVHARHLRPDSQGVRRRLPPGCVVLTDLEAALQRPGRDIGGAQGIRGNRLMLRLLCTGLRNTDGWPLCLGQPGHAHDRHPARPLADVARGVQAMLFPPPVRKGDAGGRVRAQARVPAAAGHSGRRHHRQP